MCELDGRSLSVWAIILAVGVLTLFFMGVFNPFIKKEDRKRATRNSVYGFGSSSKEKMEIELHYHFKGIAYVVVALFFGTAALISFIVENLDVLLENGKLSFAAAVVGLVVVSGIVDIMLMMFACIVEDRVVSSIVGQYEKTLGVKVVNSGYKYGD